MLTKECILFPSPILTKLTVASLFSGQYSYSYSPSCSFFDRCAHYPYYM
jgi:hypothetical protein